jgi:hypothetical protein
MIRISTYLIYMLLLLAACTSGKRAMERGSYDEAVYKAVNRLRSNSTHRKSAETLRQAYPLAKEWHLSRIKNLEISNEQFKWEPIASEYTRLNSLYDEISRCPGCLKIVPLPSNYISQYEQARVNAASDRYNAGLLALDKAKNGERNEAKTAYGHFAEARRWVNNYKDVDEKLKDAEYYATIRVVVEPIPMHSQTLKLSSEFFDNKINEFLLQAPVNRFVKFYTAHEADRLGITKPDHIIQLVFDDFVVGQTYMHEKEVQLVKDSIVLATYEVEAPTTGNATGSAAGQTGGSTREGKVEICHNGPGAASQTITVAESALKAHLEHGDKIGACSNQGGKIRNPKNSGGTSSTKVRKKVYGQVKATMHTFTRTVESKGLLDFRIIDGYTQRVISQEKMPGTFVWQSQWGHFNGDERALEKDHLRIIKNKDVPPPAPQELFIQFTQPIYQQLTYKINQFYKNY